MEARLSLVRLLAVVSLGFGLTMLSNILEPGLLGRKVLELAPGRPNTALGFTTFAGVVVALLVQPVVGVLSDRTRSRYGRRLPYLAAGTLMLVGALCLVAGAPVLGALVAGVLLIQLASNIILGPWQALTPDLVPPGQRGQVAGLKAMLDVVAVMAGRQAAGALLGRYAEWGAWALFATIAVPSLALLGALLLTARYVREGSNLAEPPPGTSLRAALAGTFAVDLRAHPAFIWWCANRFLFWMGFILLSTFQLFFVIDVVGMAEAQAQRTMGDLAVVLGGALVLIVLPAGWLSNLIGRKPLLVAAGVLATLGTGLLLVARELPLLIAAGAINGLAIGVFLSASWALIADIVPRAEAARYLGVANIASAGGSAVARLLGGLLIDPLNRAFDSSAAGYLALYGLAALCFLLSALAILPLRAQRPGAASD